MKKLIILCLTTAISTGILAAKKDSNSIDGPEKIMEIFHSHFPEIADPALSKVGDFYMVYFNEGENSACRIYYDVNGNLIKTIRNYTAEDLNPYIRQKIEAKYQGKNIYSVTDVTDEFDHYYEVIVQNEKAMWILHVNDDGTSSVKNKYKRSAI
ncbi:MAG: hypothetical protein ACTHM5_05010 [Ginsengibacter sp.]